MEWRQWCWTPTWSNWRRSSHAHLEWRDGAEANRSKKTIDTEGKEACRNSDTLHFELAWCEWGCGPNPTSDRPRIAFGLLLERTIGPISDSQ